ncbi:MAG: hypothetical protein CSB55_01740 [Candidatus Cloacimonadota bacterium]|nr:MAG: hypothetical protein CSB55_01740 [Candidatus Cloacimonadota bacterium]
MRNIFILIIIVAVTGCCRDSSKLPELQAGIVRNYIETFPVILKRNTEKDFRETNIKYYDSEKKLRKAFSRNEVDIAVLPTESILDKPKNKAKILTCINNTGVAFASIDSIRSINDLKNKKIAVIDYHNLVNILNFTDKKYNLNSEIIIFSNRYAASGAIKNKKADVIFDVLPEISAREKEGKHLFWLRETEPYVSTCQILGNESSYKIKKALTDLFLAQVYENVCDINSHPYLSYEALGKAYNLRSGYDKIVLRNTSYIYGLKPEIIKFDQEAIELISGKKTDLQDYLYKE